MNDIFVVPLENTDSQLCLIDVNDSELVLTRKWRAQTKNFNYIYNKRKLYLHRFLLSPAIFHETNP